jgi:ATP-dependent Zn protease
MVHLGPLKVNPNKPLCRWFLKGGDPLLKLTIILGSKSALGYAQYLQKLLILQQEVNL